MSDAARQYPAACVSCDKQKGYPFQVRTVLDKPGHIEIRLRCRDCGHEWIQVISNNEQQITNNEFTDGTTCE